MSVIPYIFSDIFSYFTCILNIHNPVHSWFYLFNHNFIFLILIHNGRNQYNRITNNQLI